MSTDTTTADTATTVPDLAAATAERLDALTSQLTLEEKVSLLTGGDFWATLPIEKIGLRRVVTSDGPAGVRGERWDERDPSLGLPSGTALAATWDLSVAERYGALLADEARRKGVHVVLGPTLNLHRSPLGGRHFECFSEDPLLTADLAAAYVKGMQAGGVAACPKHYVGNDFETDRFTVDTQLSGRALRELYLAAFEKAITEAHAWAVMSSYNKLNGITMTENDLLETPLNSEWGFDGIVVGDWLAVRTIEAANASQDLSMPGPHGTWADHLLAAVEDGTVAESTIDRKVHRILQLAARVGSLDGFTPAPATPSSEDGGAFARTAAADGAVLVHNSGVLPLPPTSVTRLAVIGHNAADARTQGGGSATVIPTHIVSPLEGITAAFPDAEITYAQGPVVQQGVAEIPLERMTNPDTGAPGLRIRLLRDGSELFGEDRYATSLFWFGGESQAFDADQLEIRTTYTAEADGPVAFGIGSTGVSRLWVDGELLLDENVAPVGDMLGASVITPPSVSVTVPARQGQLIKLRIEHDIVQNSDITGFIAYQFGIVPDESDPEKRIAEAVAAAQAADVAVVVVGTNSRVESEGIDRANLELPSHQDDLVRAVAAANPQTVVVVNAGAPVELPWRNDVAAVLLSWFGGQEYGNALADILTGAKEPGGRLPTTWPATEQDVPVLDVTPRDGAVRYTEGIHIGYRAWLKAGTAPAYPFGHGLGYTTWAIDSADVATADNAQDGVRVTVGVTNTGDRPGKHVVQVYASRKDTTIDRPDRWLVGFATVRAGSKESAEVTVAIPHRAFAHWDNGWAYEPGKFTLHIGSSVTDDAHTITLTLPA